MSLLEILLIKKMMVVVREQVQFPCAELFADVLLGPCAPNLAVLVDGFRLHHHAEQGMKDIWPVYHHFARDLRLQQAGHEVATLCFFRIPTSSKNLPYIFQLCRPPRHFFFGSQLAMSSYGCFFRISICPPNLRSVWPNVAAELEAAVVANLSPGCRTGGRGSAP